MVWRANLCCKNSSEPRHCPPLHRGALPYNTHENSNLVRSYRHEHSNISISIRERSLSLLSNPAILVASAQSFAPLLPVHYRDGAGVELEGRPDALCTQHCGYTVIDSKNRTLNSRRDKVSIHRALQQEYTKYEAVIAALKAAEQDDNAF